MDSKRDFFRRLSAIALPIMLQNLLSSSLSFIDTLMIGQLGSDQIAAVGIANQIFFLVNLFIFGIASGASIFFSQYYGAGRHKDLENVMGLALTLSLAVSTVFAAVSFFSPKLPVSLFTDDPFVTAISASYQRWVAVSYLFFAVSYVHSIALRSVGCAAVPLVASLISMTMNMVGNALLIFGIGPFPRLGAEGAAIATMLSRLTEMCIVMGYSYHGRYEFRIHGHSAFRWSPAFISVYIKTCLPVLLNEVLWSLGMTAYKIGYSKLGVDALACINVSESIANFFFIFAMGLGHGTTILLGQILGKGDTREAKSGASLILRTAFAIGCLMGLSMALTAPLFAGLFNVSDEIRNMASRCLFIKSAFQPLANMNMVRVVGILRAGGDTRYALFAETSCVWLIGVPMAFLGAAVLHLPIYAAVAMTSLDEAGKLLLCYPRYRSEKWIKSLAKPLDK